MLVLMQNSRGALDEAWGIVFLMAALATFVSLAIFLGTRTRSAGQATVGYAIITAGIAMLLFLDMPVVGAIVALPGLVLSVHAYSIVRSKRTRAE